MNRRDFLATSAVALSASAYAGAGDSPSERVRLAVMGVRSRGKALASSFAKLPNAEVVTLIDPDANVIPDAIKSIKGREPRIEEDVRRALEDKNVDALVVAAPDHWHALATVWACQAGKHVYVEKPVSHNPVEGRRMVQAARKYDRRVQYGAQRRSAEHYKNAAEFVKSGKLGKVPFARAWIAGNRPSIGHAKPSAVPEGVNYKLWLGPVPGKPFFANRFHYDWHWFWDTGTGEIGNNGIHGLDLVRMLLDLDVPTRVSSHGGKFFYDDDRQVPDTQVASFDFPGTTVVWEHRFWEKAGIEGSAFGIALHGEKGTLICDNNGWHVRDGSGDIAKAGEEAKTATEPHLENFLSAVRSGSPLNGDIEEGHKSTLLCHLGNIAFRTKRSLDFDAKAEGFGVPEANSLLSREYQKEFTLPEKV